MSIATVALQKENERLAAENASLKARVAELEEKYRYAVETSIEATNALAAAEQQREALERALRSIKDELHAIPTATKQGFENWKGNVQAKIIRLISVAVGNTLRIIDAALATQQQPQPAPSADAVLEPGVPAVEGS